MSDGINTAELRRLAEAAGLPWRAVEEPRGCSVCAWAFTEHEEEIGFQGAGDLLHARFGVVAANSVVPFCDALDAANQRIKNLEAEVERLKNLAAGA